jgi:hypothetical protein
MGSLNKTSGSFFKGSHIKQLIVCSAIAFACSALAKPEAIAFEELPHEIQDTLSPFADTWENIKPQRQQMLIRFSKDADADMRKRIKRHANHWKELPSEEREKVRKAIRRFENLPPRKREKLRQRWNNMPAEKRRRVDRALDQYQQLSEEKRKEIREKVRNMSPRERREFLKEVKRQIDKPPVADKEKTQQ